MAWSAGIDFWDDMGHKIPDMKAALVVHEKFVLEDGAIVEIKAWQVPKNAEHPEGYKYSMVYIDPQCRRALGYDNSKRQGHHRHNYDVQTPFEFESIDELMSRFLSEVKKLRGEPQ